MNHSDPWDSGLPYEPFMGRWSRKVAPLFLDWLRPQADRRWVDVGCGTGALSRLIVQQCRPKAVLGIDPAEAFIAYARSAAEEIPNLQFKAAGAEAIPAADHYFDYAVSALALNFFPDPAAGLAEMRRVVRPGGVIALYVWDYAAGMEMLRYFWDVALELDPQAAALDEKVRFPICQPDALEAAFLESGLEVQEVRAIDAPSIFTSFDDYWRPFLGGVGPAPGYVASLDEKQKTALRSALQERLPIQTDGSIPLTARAWAVRSAA